MDLLYDHWVGGIGLMAVSYTHLRAHETVLDILCRLLLEKNTHNLKQYLSWLSTGTHSMC